MRIVKAALIGLRPAQERPVRELLAERCIVPGPTYPSAAEACAALEVAPQEPLLFVYRVAPGEDLGQLTMLADRFAGRPILGLIPGDATAEVAMAVNRSGAAQVVPTPPRSEDFGAALDRLSLMFFGAAARRSVVLGVAGVVGGCGATTLAVNLAFEACTRRGGRVLLAESGGRIGGLAAYLGLDPRHTAADLLGAMDRADAFLLEQALTPVTDGLVALPGPSGDAAAPRGTPQQMRALLDLSRSVADTVVLDAGGAMDADQFDLLAHCDRVLLVGSQELPSVRAIAAACRELARRPGRSRPLVALNLYREDPEAVQCDRLARSLDVPRVIAVANDYRAARDAMRRGVPIRSVARRSKILAGLGEVARELLPDRAAGVPEARPGLLARWLYGRRDPASPGVRSVRGARAAGAGPAIEPIALEDRAIALHHGI